MNKSRSILRSENTRARAKQHESSGLHTYRSNHTNRHINKYHQQPQPSSIQDDKFELIDVNDDETFPEGDQIIVDIGHLKDIDNSPKNIKELSRLMADQIANMLSKELKKVNSSSEP